MSNIIYQRLEEKYVKSAQECIVQTKGQKGTYYSDFDLENQLLLENYQNTISNDESSYHNTIIAIDTNKENFVCGVFPGVDFCQYVESMRTPNKNETLSQMKKIYLQLLQPLIMRNYQPGEFIMGSGYGVRSEYENQSIGQTLSVNFILNAQELGYKLTAGIFYNPKSAHIMFKLGGSVFCYININQVQDIPEEHRKRIKNSDVYVIGGKLQENIPESKLPPILPLPKL